MHVFDFSDERQSRFHHRYRLSERDRERRLRLDRVEQRDKLADLHTGQRYG